ncbi:hypothetical protein LY76DRAFT_166360 [Colletotrichum caudatum]|nr:hypothetical protein LY76DRAFT_166360 [Colletotrichum caudatum]
MCKSCKTLENVRDGGGREQDRIWIAGSQGPVMPSHFPTADARSGSKIASLPGLHRPLAAALLQTLNIPVASPKHGESKSQNVCLVTRRRATLGGRGERKRKEKKKSHLHSGQTDKQAPKGRLRSKIRNASCWTRHRPPSSPFARNGHPSAPGSAFPGRAKLSGSHRRFAWLVGCDGTPS